MKKFSTILRVMLVLVTLTAVIPASAQYGSRGDKRYRDRYSRANTYGDVVELRLSDAGTLKEKMPAGMVDRVRLLRIEGPMNSKDFAYIKELCSRSRCYDNRDKKVDNYIDLELERVRIISAGTKGLFGDNGERDVLGDALSHATHLRSIVLPERTKRIASDALRGCYELEEVIMPPGVRSLGNHAFDGCSRLEYITLSENIETIGRECFNGCTRLRSVNLPRSLVEVGERAFRGTGLQRVTLPYGLEQLGANAFENTQIVNLDLPATTRIADNALGIMDKLEAVTVENGSRYYTHDDGVLYDNTGKVLLCCPAGRQGAMEVPDGVEALASRSFTHSRLSSVTLPDGLREIGPAAFYLARQLRTINIPASVTDIGEEAFGECEKLQQIDLPGVTRLGKKAFIDCHALQSARLAAITVVPQSAFQGCGALTIMILPDEITAIGDGAFKNCKSLTAIDLPAGLTAIGKEALRGCLSLTEVDLGNKLVSLGDNALRETSITTLVIPESVTKIGKKITEKCKNLTRIECHAVLPPALDKESNNKVDLYVPAPSVNAYRSAKTWKNFKNIYPLE